MRYGETDDHTNKSREAECIWGAACAPLLGQQSKLFSFLNLTQHGPLFLAFCSDDFCVMAFIIIIIIISENYPELENKMELLASQHLILVGLKSNQIH